MGYKLKDFPKHVQQQVKAQDDPNGLDVCKGSQTIFINKLPPGLNGSNGLMQLHWAKYQKLKDKWIEYVFEIQPKRHVGKVDITYTRKSVRMMDFDNLSASFKPVGDALEELGVIDDDSPATIRKFDVRWKKANMMRAQGVEIIIEDVE